MPDTWTRYLNWLTPAVPGNDISPYCPDIAIAHQHDPDAKSARNSTSVPGVSKTILKAITMMPYQLRSAGIIDPLTPSSNLELQMEIKSESYSDTHTLTLAVSMKHGIKKAVLYHTCRGLSDSHACYHMIMALAVYNLYTNQGNPFYRLLRNNMTKRWDPVDLLRAGDEFYSDIRDGTIPRDVELAPETGKRNYTVDLMPFIIHGSPIPVNNQIRQISIDTTTLLETMDRAANTAFRL